MRYEFGTKDCTDGAVKVNKENLYTKDTSYGFLIEKNRMEDKDLQIPEINSGFDTAYWFYGMEISEIAESDVGCHAVSFYDGTIPCTFKCNVPKEGNYKVTVTMTAAEDVKEGILFLGRRRMAERRSFVKGECFTGTYLANICPIIPRNYENVMEDLTLDVTVVGKGLALSAVEVEEVLCPTIYIAGDSTVTDQSADYPYVSFNSYSGWGQMLGAYVGCEMAVSNHSHSGLTTESFRSEGHYDILISHITKGDYCLIQFAHNDQKLDHLKAKEGYRDNLLRYIKEIREKQATPVFVTPLARNTWKGNDGTYNDLLTEYEEVMREVGQTFDVPVVELHADSRAFIEKMGRDDAKAYFFPSDYTHSNDYGAYKFAGMVYKRLLEFEILHNETSLAEWTPENLVIPQPPEELKDKENPNAVDAFADLERLDDNLLRTESLEFVISCMHFFPTNVYNDMFTDVIGHETYAGTVECGVQNGIIPQEVVESGIFRPLETVTAEEFFTFLKNGYSSRKSDVLEAKDLLEEGFLDKKTITRGEAADICRKLHV